MDRKQFTFYESFFDAISCIPSKEDRADAYEAIAGYALKGEEPPDGISPMVRAIYLLAKPTLDTSRQKSEAGKVGGKKAPGTPEAGSKDEVPFDFASPDTGSEREAPSASASEKCESRLQAPLQSASPTCVSTNNSAYPTVGSRNDSAYPTCAREKEIEKEIEIEKESSTPPTPSFREFYLAYPRKTQPTRAEAVWQSLLGKGILPPMRTLLAALEAQKNSQQWQKEGGRFIPAPAKWLSEHRWNDKLPPTPGTPGTPGKLAKQAVARMMATAEEADAYGAEK